MSEHGTTDEADSGIHGEAELVRAIAPWPPISEEASKHRIGPREVKVTRRNLTSISRNLLGKRSATS